MVVKFAYNDNRKFKKKGPLARNDSDITSNSPYDDDTLLKLLSTTIPNKEYASVLVLNRYDSLM